MGSTRGQLRPQFSGRSPPFLVAALCVGLAILGISYYTLSSQHTYLEHDLTKLLEKNTLLDKELDVTKQQLHLKEDEFVKTKTQLEAVTVELEAVKKSLEDKTSQNTILESKIKDLQTDLDTTREDLNSVREAKDKVEAEKTRLIQENSKLISDHESLSKEISRLKQELERTLIGQSNVIPEEKKENKKVDRQTSHDKEDALPVAAANVRDDKTQDKNSNAIPPLPDDTAAGKDRSAGGVVGDEVSGKIAMNEDKLANLIDSKDAAEEAKRRDPTV